MKKYEADLEMARLAARRTELWIGFWRYFVLCITIIVSLWVIFWGMHPFIGQDANAIRAFSSFIAALNIGNWLSYLIAAVLGVAWWHERSGKKRAIQQKAHFQDIVERNDLNRSSSGLTPTGDTP